jgi:hypothetical protein
MKHKFFIAAGLIVVIALGVFIMMLGDSKPSSFELKDGNLVIGGSFGVSVPLSGISGLGLADIPPKIETKTDGAGLGTVYKGEFTLDGGVKARLYYDALKPPFITFSSGGTVFYINAATPEETQALYQQLEDALN